MMLKTCLYRWIAIVGLLLNSPVVLAGVDLLSGKYTYDALDMKIQTLGGSISITRSWDEDHWVQSSGWSPLTLTYGVVESEGGGLEITGIQRGSDVYTYTSESVTDITLPNGSAGYHKRITYLIDGKQDQWIVREGDIAGQAPNWAEEELLPIRWEGTTGYWIEYRRQDPELLTAMIHSYGDRTGVIANFTYDTDDKLLSITDRNDAPVITYTYYPDGKLQTVEDNTGRGVEYRYTGDQLTEVVDVRNNLTQYAYQNNRLFRITDQENRIKEIGYAANGRVETETLIDIDGTRSVTSYRYDYDKTKKEIYIQVKEPMGGVTEKWYDKDRNLIRKVVNGRQVYVQTIDTKTRTYHVFDQRGLETIEEYDEWFNRVKVTYPDGSFTTHKYKPTTNLPTEKIDELGRITQYTYYDNGLLKSKTEAVGTDVERTTTYTYNADGQLTEKRRLADANTEEAITTYGYDPAGNRNRITGPEGGVTRFTHNIFGAVLTRIDPNDKTWEYEYDNAGNRVSQTNPLTHAVNMTYDGVGNLKTVADARTYLTKYEYNVHNKRTSTTDPYNHTTKIGYDLAGKLTSVTDPLDNAQTLVYDLSGRIIRQEDAAGNITKMGYGEQPGESGGLNGDTAYPSLLNRTEYPTYLQTYDYDKRDRIIQTIDHLDNGPAIAVTEYYANGNKRSTIDAEQRKTEYRYDALDRLIEIIDPALQSTYFKYDNRDNLIAVTDPNNHTTRYTYDKANRKKSEIRPGGQTILYDYDPAGNLTTVTDPDGRKTVNHYDDAGRLERQEHFAIGASVPERTVDYGYDNNDNLTSWSDGAISAVITFDKNNRKTGETVNYGTFSLSHSYGYDAAGNKKTYTGPDNVTITYHWDKGRLGRIEIPNEGSIYYNSYQWSQPEKITWPGGSTRTVSYEADLKPTRILDLDPGDNPLLDYQYSYDKTGNIKQKITQHDTYDYGYDLLQRLTEAASTAETEGWEYDPNGNRRADNLSPGAWVYDVNDRLLASPGVTYSYDDAGNTTSKTEGGTTTTYLYNAEGRLSRIEDANQDLIAEYIYDPLGRRIKKTTQNETLYFHYADEGLMGEFDATGNLIRLYGYVPDSTWTTDPLYVKSALGYGYYLNDHLGTPQQVIAKNGAKDWEGVYQAFGEIKTETGSLNQKLRFPGQYYDQESGNYYNYNRDYDSSTANYIQSDPIGLEGGLNTFAYANNNPINSIDPYGLFCVKVRGIRICLPKGKKDRVKNNPKPKPNLAPCWVYNIVDCNGEIVYVGITNNLTRRQREHEAKEIIKRYQCNKCKLKMLPMRKFKTRAACKAAETLEIKTMNPIFNTSESDIPDVDRIERRKEWRDKNCC